MGQIRKNNYVSYLGILAMAAIQNTLLNFYLDIATLNHIISRFWFITITGLIIGYVGAYFIVKIKNERISKIDLAFWGLFYGLAFGIIAMCLLNYRGIEKGVDWTLEDINELIMYFFVAILSFVIGGVAANKDKPKKPKEGARNREIKVEVIKPVDKKDSLATLGLTILGALGSIYPVIADIAAKISPYLG